LKGKYTRGRKVEEKKKDRSSSSKDKYTSNCWWSTRTIIASVPGLV